DRIGVSGLFGLGSVLRTLGKGGVRWWLFLGTGIGEQFRQEGLCAPDRIRLPERYRRVDLGDQGKGKVVPVTDEPVQGGVLTFDAGPLAMHLLTTDGEFGHHAFDHGVAHTFTNDLEVFLVEGCFGLWGWTLLANERRGVPRAVGDGTGEIGRAPCRETVCARLVG